MADFFQTVTDSAGLTDSRFGLQKRSRIEAVGLLDSRLRKQARPLADGEPLYDAAWSFEEWGEFNEPADTDIPNGGLYEPEPVLFAKNRVAFMSASVRQATPTTPDADSMFMRLSAAASNQVQALVDVAHGVPLGVGAQILRAELVLFKAESWSAGGTLTATPAVEEWDADNVTWDTRPALNVSYAASVSAPIGGADGDSIVIPVSPAIAALVESEEAGGPAFEGFLLSLTGNDVRRLWGATAEPDVSPYLLVEYNVPPLPPSNLSPSGGRKVSLTQPVLLFDFSDPDLDDSMAGGRVQIDTDATFETPLYDSLMVPMTEGLFDLDNPPAGAVATPTLSTSTIYFWRAQAQDVRGLESDFSDIETFQVVAKPTVTLTNPSGGTVASPTPTFTFTYTGTQEQVEVIIEVMENEVWEDHYVFDQQVSSLQAFTLPDGYRLSEDDEYRVTVRVWDDEDREDMGGDRSFSEDSQEFTLTAVSVVGP